MPNPTIVSASLDDKELKQSIANLVAHVKRGLHTMLTDTNSTVDAMEKKLKTLGNLKIDSNGTADGGASKRAKAQNAETDAVEKNIAARDKQIKKNQEAATSFDNFAKAQQVAIRSANPSGIRNAEELRTMNIQLDLLRERLREARQQYSSFVALAAHATTTGDKGLFQYATEGVHRYEQEVRNLIPQIRTLQSGIRQMGDVIAPQGHTIQNYVNSLQKANPELAALNAQYKSGTSLLQDQSTSYASATQSAQRYTEEIRKQAQAIRESAEYKAGKYVSVTTPSGYDAVINIKDRISIEDKLTEAYQKHIGQKSVLDRIEQTDNEVAKERLGTETAITNEISKRKKYSTPETQVGYDVTRDKLAQIIATRNNIQRNQVVNWDEQTSSIKTLSAALKQYQEAYVKMSATERNSPFGKQMIADMQVLERNIQKFRQQMSRPIDFGSVMNLPQKTLDDIAYKMQRLRAYKQGIDLTKPNSANEIKQVDEALARLQKDADKWMSKSQEMIKSNTALGRSWNYMKNRLAFYFTVGASTSFVKQLIDIRGQYELLERSIGILIDSAQNGSQIFAELNAMAIKSPFTTMELGAAAKQLVAYDVTAKDVVDTTRRLADMAAAVGIPIERLTYALGQIKAYGYLNARDARMFANAGIPLVKELADYYTELEGRLVSTADVYDRIKKKAIDYNDVMSVVNKMTDEGGKFFDFQEKAADTLKVRIANLTLAWNNMLNEMGKDNQGILTEGLKVTKQIFESWRDINNMVIALGLTYGTIKAAQIAYYLWVMRTEKAVGAWSKIINAIDYAFNAKIANVINSLKTSLVGFFTNPAAMLTVAFTALSVALTKAYLDYRDLQAANEEFNKSVVKNAEENVKSIDKFFGDYKKQLESAGSLNSADQTKLWERVQEEIEKTTKNAEKYIEILNKIPEISKRIEVGESVLEQSKRIQDELKYMAERGMFNVGGGFANDSAAKDLQQYNDAVNELITKYGDLDNAKKKALKVNEITLESGETIRQYTGEYVDFQRAQIEAEKELQNIVSTLDKVNIAEVLGSGDMDTQLANVRSFAIAWRDAFLATEKGSKISAEGQALLNSYIDKWIEQQARVNHLIKDENTAAVEANRTAWETFFKFLNTEERKRLDVAIKTNQLESKAVQDLWDEASKRMQKNATTSYNLIQQQIADLRNTPDIVINVVYRNNKEKLEKDQEEFEKKFIQPKNWGVLSTDEYLKQEKANREKYGTLMRKQGEDTAEYEKRISDERKKNLELSEKNGKIIEENKNKTSEYSIAVTELADKEKKAADDRLKVIKEVEKNSGYDFSTKSENAAARKAAKQAETELQKALKDELSTIEKVRSIYKDLTKEGMSHANAVERATKGWDETVNAINRALQKNGLRKLDLSKFAGIENPRELVNMLQSQLNTLLKRGAKPVEIKELQTKIQTLNVDAEKYDLTKITKGLNSELDRLKEEYELAVELDANPEMGNLFADWMGIDMSTLPHTAEEYAKRMTKALNKYLADEKSGIEIGSLLALTDDDLRMFQQRVDNKELTQVWVDNIVKNAKEARNALKKENSDIAKEWDSLIQKYSEYEYKIAQVQRNANKERKAFALKYGTNDQKERALVLTTEIDAEEDQAKKQELINQLKQLLVEIAGDDDSKLKIPATIDKKELEEGAKISFEKFQKSPEWIVATGDLAGMTNKAIGGLINSIESYKKKAKNLDPKQIKNINNALRKLYKQQREGNPFLVISNAIDQAKARMEDIQPALDSTMSDIIKLEKEIGDTEPTEEQAKALDKLKKKWKELYEVGQLSASDIVSGINSAIDVAVKASESFNKMAEALGGTNMTKAAKTISDITGNLQAAGQGAAAAAQISGGNGWAAAAGATIGGLTDLVTRFAEQWSGNKSQTERVKEVEDSVGELELAYIDLEHAVDKAMGTAVIGAKQAALANKQAQLESIKRQLELEKERDSKYRDSEKILSLEKQYKELFNEIQDGYTELVDTIMGTDVSSFAENLVSSMITAFKQGEDYMKVFSDKFDEMIDNMIMKSIVSRVVSSYLNKIWDAVDERINNRAKEEREAYKKSQEFSANIDVLSDDERRWNLAWDRAREKRGNDASLWDARREYDSITEDDIKKYVEAVKAEEKAAKTRLEAATEFTDSDIDFVMSEINETMPELGEKLKGILGQYYKFGESSDKNLSALQQGLQSMSESTAESLEAYMNGVSQQVYYHSSLLEQIRDSVVGLDLDVSLGVQSQMLLQLQNSYQTQQAIQQILEGVLNPSGRAFSVELVS